MSQYLQYYSRVDLVHAFGPCLVNHILSSSLNLLERQASFSSAQRLASSNIVEFAPHITATNSDFRFIIGEQLQDIGIDPGPILIEPQAKNTAAAILAVSLFAFKDEAAILLVAPSDHVIPDKVDFHQAIKVGLTYAQNGKIVTFGISQPIQKQDMDI